MHVARHPDARDICNARRMWRRRNYARGSDRQSGANKRQTSAKTKQQRENKTTTRTLDGLLRRLVAEANVLPETQRAGLVLLAEHAVLALEDRRLLLVALLSLRRTRARANFNVSDLAPMMAHDAQRMGSQNGARTCSAMVELRMMNAAP